jgi:hypothetical protein
VGRTIAIAVATGIGVAATLLPGPAEGRVVVAIGANLGVDFPAGDALGPGGVWHLAVDLAPGENMLIAAELGTAAFETGEERTVTIDGIPRDVIAHAVSTLGLVARRSLGTGGVRPYVAAGADWYTSWEDYDSPTGREWTTNATGLGLLFGVGGVLAVSGRLDAYAEGVYHLATHAEADARYAALQGGLRFYMSARAPGR